MANLTNIQQPGKNNGTGTPLDSLLKVFSGEVLTAFNRQTLVMPNHIVKTIESGKSAQFPVSGRAEARYLQAGANLDDTRTEMKHNEKLIHIDGLLVSDVLITDIYNAMSHVDWRQEYSKQLGETLAQHADLAVLAEMAKLAKEQETLPGLGGGTVITKTLGAGATGITQALGDAVIQGLMEVRAKFTKNYVPMDERYVYITPEAYNSLLASKTAIDRDYGAVATIVDGNLDKLLGFKVIEVPNISTGTSANGVMQGVGHVFPSDLTNVAFIAGHRSCVGTLKLKDLQIEHGRRMEYQADHIVAKYAMGHGGLRPEAVAVCNIK
ncbi:phage capsid protein [Veillonella sp. CHU740]|uniref:phage capsid protein n=1 Tax=Veillonella sp. CHU740 TaxID=2490950 RepID=UPI000F8EEF67|nr:phage capsid protein [Veillonella sp. CHU740]